MSAQQPSGVSKHRRSRILPVVSHGAEFLVQGYLMRRNILAYKAPPNNEGYDLVCIHPDPRRTKKQVRIQVKSRYQTDCDLAFPVKEKSFGAFDYLTVVFLNIGYFYGKYRKGKSVKEGIQEPKFYTFPVSFIREHHHKMTSWQKVKLRGLNIKQYENNEGFEQIARDLGVEYPSADDAGVVTKAG